MGTRADFYIGKPPDVEWLGSVAFDGYPEGIPDYVKYATTAADYGLAVVRFLNESKSATLPEQGWPWPWDDSTTTDYAYIFIDDKVWASCWGTELFDPLEAEPDSEEERPELEWWPDMSAIKKVTLGPRSGLLVLHAPKDP